jgi:hypothetical protein
MLFLLINALIEAIFVISRMCQNDNTNEDLIRNPYLLYILSTFSLSRDEVKEVVKYENHKEEDKMVDIVVVEE